MKTPITNSLICSPFRKDENPTCGFYYNWHGKLRLHDFANKQQYDVFDIVSKLFNLNFPQTLDKIIEDCEELDFNNVSTLEKTKEITYIYDNSFHDYYSTIPIRMKTLKFFCVKPVKAVYRDSKLLYRATENNPIFVTEFPNGNYKFYRPLSPEKSKKHLNVCTHKDIQGEAQLPPKGKTLIISKSMKDVMLLRDMGIFAVSFMSEALPEKESESRTFIENKVQEYRKRFDNVFALMDNDDPGKRASKLWEDIYGVKALMIPDNEEKDPSDISQTKGFDYTKRLIKKLIRHETKVLANTSSRVTSHLPY